MVRTELTQFYIFERTCIRSLVTLGTLVFLLSKRLECLRFLSWPLLINGPVLRSNNFSWCRVRSNNFGQNLSFLASHQFLHLKITRAYLIFKLVNEILRNLALTCHNISKNVPIKLVEYKFFSKVSMLVRAGEMAVHLWSSLRTGVNGVTKFWPQSKNCHQHLSPTSMKIDLGNWDSLFLLRVQYRFQVPFADSWNVIFDENYKNKYKCIH